LRKGGTEVRQDGGRNGRDCMGVVGMLNK